MRILSNSAKYHHLVQNEVRQYAQDAQGVLQGYVLKPQIMLEFHQSGITAYEYEFGFRHWGSASKRDDEGRPLDPWGAHPDTRDGALEGRIYVGWDARLQFSVIDTESYQGEERAAIEAYFEKNPQGENWVTVVAESITPPWPTYDSTHHNKVGVLAHDLGLVAEAIRYELATKNRDSVLKSLQKEHVREVEEAEEDAALKVIVP